MTMSGAYTASGEMPSCQESDFSDALAEEPAIPESEYPPLEDVWMDRDSILDRVWVHLNTLTCDTDTYLLLYSALELRFFIESLFFELLTHYRGDELHTKDLKTYQPKEYCSILARLEPAYVGEAAAVLGTMQFDTVTLARLVELHGRLGGYVHLPKMPFLQQEHEEWKQDLERVVISSFKYLNDFTRDPWRTKKNIGNSYGSPSSPNAEPSPLLPIS